VRECEKRKIKLLIFRPKNYKKINKNNIKYDHRGLSPVLLKFIILRVKRNVKLFEYGSTIC